MPKRATTVYVCSECGEEYLQWQGRCSNCGNWNTIQKFHLSQPHTAEKGAGYAGTEAAAPIPLASVQGQEEQRFPSGFSEVDRVLGGGIVAGSVILLGGDPGIGKSTLLLQLAERIADARHPVLYVSGEESPEQIKLRAVRLGMTAGSISLLAATNISRIEQIIEEGKPRLVVIDSIQTMYDEDFPSTPGSIVQVRESALRLQRIAKRLAIPMVLVGHITKEGTVAGPRTLEHLVDVVLYLEGENKEQLRILRAVKNRFGDSSETGIFAMEEQGMTEVSNPGNFLLQERVQAPGSVLSAVMEGSRPLLIEVQALTTPSLFGYPRRTSSGFDLNRLNLLLAVLQKRAGVNLSNQDVFINIVGGLKIKDPALDAAVCVALASAHKEVALPETLCVIGEIGLAGELRRVSQQERRIKEIKNLGYTTPKPVKSLGQLVGSVLR
ncbi:DNA repair protein RadA [Patescibacteria group bacterium]|nr:DNA repair protein RadA [Patescibacteria group bacterium]